MPDFGELDSHFLIYAVVTPDGKIPTVEEDSSLNDPSHWYTSPIGTIAHLLQMHEVIAYILCVDEGVTLVAQAN